jgi:hypothetical protein
MQKHTNVGEKKFFLLDSMTKMTEFATFHTSHLKNCINLVHPSVCECCRKVNRSSVYSGKEIYAVPRKYVKKTFSKMKKKSISQHSHYFFQAGNKRNVH